MIPLGLSLTIHSVILSYSDGEAAPAAQSPGVITVNVKLSQSVQKEETASQPAPPKRIEEKPSGKSVEKQTDTGQPQPTPTVKTQSKERPEPIPRQPVKTNSSKPNQQAERASVPVEPKDTAGEPIDQLSQSENKNEKTDEFQQWVAQLQYRINRNKAYPYQAKRRRLEGEVKMEAIINSDGTLQNARILSGRKVFQASSLKAIHQSLPLPPPDQQPVTVVFSIHYRLL
jgi:protein TonB